MAASPRWPAPMTRTVEPRCTPPYSSAQRTPAPSGLYMTAISAGMSFLIGCTMEFGCRSMYSAYPPVRRSCRSGGLPPPWLPIRLRQFM